MQLTTGKIRELNDSINSITANVTVKCSLHAWQAKNEVRYINCRLC